MIGEYRIFADAKFESPSNNRPFRIEAKGRTYFVEPNYGRNYNLADRYGLVVFAIGVAGAFYVQHRERKDLKK